MNKAKTIRLTFKAPIICTYEYEIDVEEIENGDVNKYIADITSDMSNIADNMYQINKEDLYGDILNNICLCSVEKVR